MVAQWYVESKVELWSGSSLSYFSIGAVKSLNFLLTNTKLPSFKGHNIHFLCDIATLSSSSQVSLSQQSLPTPAPPTNLVMGVSDWDFLCPVGMEPGPDEDTSKRPSLEEFDGELAIFQVPL